MPLTRINELRHCAVPQHQHTHRQCICTQGYMGYIYKQYICISAWPVYSISRIGAAFALHYYFYYLAKCSLLRLQLDAGSLGAWLSPNPFASLCLSISSRLFARFFRLLCRTSFSSSLKSLAKFFIVFQHRLFLRLLWVCMQHEVARVVAVAARAAATASGSPAQKKPVYILLSVGVCTTLCQLQPK